MDENQRHEILNWKKNSGYQVWEKKERKAKNHS